jgi:hypothetical protein
MPTLEHVRPRRAALVAVGAALAAAGCGHIVLKDARVAGDDWSLVVQLFKDGPDSFSAGHVYFVPGPGERLFWVRVSLRNDAAAAREFNFDRCDLDNGNAAVVPGAVAAAPISYETDRASAVRPGETLERWLLFSYPKDHSPARLSCAPMVVRLPPIPPR